MKILGRHVIARARSGTYNYAIVESISGGRATVRLGNTGKGSRITNLHVAGQIFVGSLVIVDYSVDQPYVRAAFSDAETVAQLNLAVAYSSDDGDEELVED